MNDITVEHNATPAKLDVLYVDAWPIWEKQPSTFPWTYEQKETCYILEGKATVTPDDGSDPVTLIPGDLVIFTQGLTCQWEVHTAMRKHYLLQD